MARTSRHRVHPRGKRHRYQRHELVAAASGAVLVIVIAVLSAWAHQSLSNARPAATNSAAVQPASAASAAPPPSPSLRVQIRAWLDDARPSIHAVVIAGDNVVATAARADIGDASTACQMTAAALASAQQHLPSPDPVLNIALQQAFNDYQDGISWCIRGTQNQDAVDIGQAAGFIEQGEFALQRAFDIVEADLLADSDVLTV
ncbi:MAG TPA: hypothetical protein VMB04_10835 [Mycobacterium sp.]|nr:hypothetical protein [Mycobacterium sp.]